MTDTTDLHTMKRFVIFAKINDSGWRLEGSTDTATEARKVMVSIQSENGRDTVVRAYDLHRGLRIDLETA